MSGPQYRPFQLFFALVAIGFASLVSWREGNNLGLAFAQPAVPRLEPASPDPLASELSRLLTEQKHAWNRGDVDSFMKPYLKSDELTFSSGGHVTRGWQATLENYRKRYPDRKTMGRLEFSELEVKALGDNAALVLGNWFLTREEDSDVGGSFTLVFQRIDGNWLIIHDHTSRSEAPTEPQRKQPEKDADGSNG